MSDDDAITPACGILLGAALGIGFMAAAALIVSVAFVIFGAREEPIDLGCAHLTGHARVACTGAIWEER